MPADLPFFRAIREGTISNSTANIVASSVFSLTMHPSFDHRSFRSTLLVLVLVLIGTGRPEAVFAQCNQDYLWAVWSNFSGQSATGTITTPNGPVTVTMTANYTFDSTPNIFNYAAFAGFGGPLPPNATVPRTTWAAGPGGETTMCFSETVTNPVLLISSLGNPGTPVTLQFSLPYEVVFDGGGMTWVNSTTVIGTEGYCILVFPGDFDCVTIYSSTPEYYTNITWGINPPLFEVTIDGDTIACESTTLTASGGQTYNWSGGQNPNSPANTFTQSGFYGLTVSDANGCTVVTNVNVTIHPTYESDIQASICEGDFYEFDGQYLTDPGVYQANLATIFDCDSLITLDLTVHPLAFDFLSESICEGEVFEFDGNVYSESGLYVAVLPDVYGCDSTVTLDLTVHPQSLTVDEDAICEGETLLWNGQALDQPGLYTATLANASGCDSTVLLTLAVIPAVTNEFSLALCAGETFPFHGQDLSQPGDYSALLVSAQGCDSTVTVHLSVLPSDTTYTEAEICTGEPFLFLGDTLTAAGIYPAQLSDPQGCDSTVILTLSVLPPDSTDLSAGICTGESYVFFGDTLVLAGTYPALLSNTQGCDSLLTLTLDVWPVKSTGLNAQICPGGSFPFDGQTLTAAGTYTAQLQTAQGCDSTVTLTLDVLSVIQTQDLAAICPGEVYMFAGQALDQPGTYADTLVSVGGCDSISILQLNVLTIPPGSESAAICTGETLTWNGQALDQAGTYDATLASAQGCDSTSTLTLAVHPVFSIPVQAQICSGQTYTFDGNAIGQPGTYTAHLQSQHGCDSTVNLTLQVVSVIEETLSAHLCDGDTYTFGGSDLSAPGTYTDTLSAIGGCDSVVTLTLTTGLSQLIDESIDLCEGETLVFNGQVLGTTGTYTASGKATNGCDSTRILKLTVHPGFHRDDLLTGCDAVTWPVTGQTFTQNTTLTEAYQTVHGCDSIYTATILVTPSFHQTDDVSTSNAYIWPLTGQTFTHSGTYTQALNTVSGCDSVYTLILTVNDRMYIPTAFSPNDDGINDRFTIYGSGNIARIELMAVYDRWGNALARLEDFPPNDPGYGWDGSFRDRRMDPGVYIFTARLRMTDGSSRWVKGEVTLVK